MLNPFIDLLATVIYLYLWCVIIWVVLTTLISFKVVNAHQEVVQRVLFVLSRLCNPALRPIRRFIPVMAGIDLSPIVLLLLLEFSRNALYHYFYNL